MKEYKERLSALENMKITEKVCSECNRLLPISEFDWNGHTNWKPKCRECEKEWYRQYRVNRGNERKAMTTDLKASVGCLLCGERVPLVLIFHHLDPATKYKNVATILNSKIELINNELAKCVVLCRNCHTKVHAGILEVGDGPYPPLSI